MPGTAPELRESASMKTTLMISQEKHVLAPMTYGRVEIQRHDSQEMLTIMHPILQFTEGKLSYTKGGLEGQYSIQSIKL